MKSLQNFKRFYVNRFVYKIRFKIICEAISFARATNQHPSYKWSYTYQGPIEASLYIKTIIYEMGLNLNGMDMRICC